MQHMVNLLLKNPVLSDLLNKNGYVLIDAGLESEIEKIWDYIHQQHFSFGTGFYYSLIANGYKENQEIQKAISEQLHSFYITYFEGFRSITESFLMKPANTESELSLHQDWCYTDERKFEAYNIWIPLCDVSEQNGAMFFLAGSHHWFNNYRSGSLPTARIEMQEIESKVITVPMKRGQVLVFHPAVFHGSFPNQSAKNRVVVTSTIMNQNAPFLHYQRKDEERMQVFILEDDAFLKNLPRLANSEGAFGELSEEIDYKHAMVQASDLNR